MWGACFVLGARQGLILSHRPVGWSCSSVSCVPQRWSRWVVSGAGLLSASPALPTPELTGAGGKGDLAKRT